MTSKPRAWNRIAWMVAAVPLLALALPTLASAQDTVHPVSMTLKLVEQDYKSNNAESATIDKSGANQKDLFELCTGDKPTSKQGVFLSVDCESPNTNRIVVADTDPIDVFGTVGSITFNLGAAVDQESNSGDLKKSIVPVSVSISCIGFSGTLTGIATVDYKALPDDGPICPNSATLDVSGTANGGSIILNEGTTIKAKNRTSSIDIPSVQPVQ